MPGIYRNLGEAKKVLKSVKELSETHISTLTSAQTSLMTKQDVENYNKILKDMKSIFKTEKEYIKFLQKANESLKTRLNLHEKTGEELEDYLKNNKHIQKALEDQLKEINKIQNAEKARAQILDRTLRVLQKMSDESLKQFKMAQEMQTISNLTWREYTAAYQEAYKAARQMNIETGKQLHQAKDIIELQNQLMKDGWKDLDFKDLTNISTSARMIATTLGVFPVELSTALQASYKQFGEQTSLFATALGNRLNAFSKSFGVSIGMLTGVVTQMSTSTSFLARNNMKAQILANESLMKAAALSGAIGLTSTDFITQLAGTAQFGTAGEMSALYSGGAMLQGFDVDSFQRQMIGGQSDLAISSLFSSIYSTMQGLEGDHYLRAEYMKQIGDSFGLSRSDMLNIMTHGGDLSKYEENIQEKLLDVETSMRDEVAGLRVDIKDQIKNWWNNTTLVQGFNKTMQNLGLHGILDPIQSINWWVRAIGAAVIGQSAGGLLKKAGGLFTRGASVSDMANLSGVGAAGSGMSLGGKILGTTAGLGIGIGTNIAGRAVQTNTNYSDAGANIGGGALNILGGVGGGALAGFSVGGPVGAAVGGIIGGLAGIANTIAGAQERQSALRDIEDKRRLSARAASTTSSGDPTVDAINYQTQVLERAITGTAETQAQYQMTVEMYRDVNTVGEIVPVKK